MTRSSAVRALAFVLFVAAGCAAAQPMAPSARPYPDLRVAKADGTVDLDTIETLVNAHILGEETRFREAATLFEAAPNPPRAPRYYALWLRIYLALGEVEKGAALLERVLGEHPRSVEIQALRLSYAVRKNCKECADAATEAMRKIAPDHPLTYRSYGHYDLSFFGGLRASEYLEKAVVGLDKGYLPWAYSLLGQSYDKQARGAEAITAWRKAAELAPFSSHMAAEHAVMLAHYSNDYEAATREAQRALERDNLPRARHALVHADYGRWAAAYAREPGSATTRALFDEAVARDGNFVTVFQHACVYAASTPIVTAMLKEKLVPTSTLSEQDERGYTCIGNTIDNGNGELVRVMIGLGADIDALNAKGHSPLIRAVLHNDAKTVKLLLELGANVNATSMHGSALNVLSLNAERSLDMARQLLDAKADPNSRSVEEETPLHGAALRLDIELGKLLLERGADVDALRIGRFTPLRWALNAISPPGSGVDTSKRAAFVELLMQHGADPEIKPDRAQSPLEYAKESRPELVKLLER